MFDFDWREWDGLDQGNTKTEVLIVVGIAFALIAAFTVGWWVGFSSLPTYPSR